MSYSIVVVREGTCKKSDRPKRERLAERFCKRQMARNWLRNNLHVQLTDAKEVFIRHPDGTEELYHPKS